MLPLTDEDVVPHAQFRTGEEFSFGRGRRDRILQGTNFTIFSFHDNLVVIEGDFLGEEKRLTVSKEDILRCCYRVYS